jgi:hypothetical protein
VSPTGQIERVPLDPHLAAPHRVALDVRVFECDHALARQSKFTVQMAFVRRFRRERVHSSGDLDDALFAFALSDTRRRHTDTNAGRGIEYRHPDGYVDAMAVDGDR